MAARVDSFDVLRALDVPTLVIVGEEDGLTPVAESEAIAGAVPGARLVVLPRTGHLSALEDADGFNAAVRDFLAELA
jgi:pimeloyl-ACP methyl ester carboxylesterase